MMSFFPFWVRFYIGFVFGFVFVDLSLSVSQVEGANNIKI